MASARTRNWSVPWAAPLLLAALLAAALPAPRAAAEEKPKKEQVQHLEAGDLARIQEEIFVRLGQAFLRGDCKACLALFAPPQAGPEAAQQEQVAEALRREFQNERYTAFAVPEQPESDGRLGDTPRYGVWVRLRFSLEEQRRERRREGAAPEFAREALAGGGFCLRLPPADNAAAPRPARSATHNDVFIVERQADGSWRLVSSPYFATLGQRQGIGLVADALLAAIGTLAALAFWVWMGCAALRFRPRLRLWRLLVLLVPFLGALVFFFAVYVRKGRQGEAVAGGG